MYVRTLCEGKKTRTGCQNKRHLLYAVPCPLCLKMRRTRMATCPSSHCHIETQTYISSEAEPLKAASDVICLFERVDISTRNPKDDGSTPIWAPPSAQLPIPNNLLDHPILDIAPQPQDEKTGALERGVTRHAAAAHRRPPWPLSPSPPPSPVRNTPTEACMLLGPQLA